MVNTRAHDPSADQRDRLFSAECSMARLAFRRADVPAVRRFATVFGARSGMPAGRLADLALVVSEAAACTVSQGPCTASLRLWTTGARLIGETRGDGLLLGHRPRAVEQGDADALRRRILRRLCDHASVEAGPYGVTVRFSMSVT
jgi:hypothetical protein